MSIKKFRKFLTSQIEWCEEELETIEDYGKERYSLILAIGILYLASHLASHLRSKVEADEILRWLADSPEISVRALACMVGDFYSQAWGE